jgi:hypothetical protein
MEIYFMKLSASPIVIPALRSIHDNFHILNGAVSPALNDRHG